MINKMMKLNPLASMGDSPMAPDAEPQGEGDEQQQIADLQSRVDDLEQRVAALEGPEQEEQPGGAPFGG